MANKKISELTSATLPLAGTEELAIVQGGETKKVAASDLGGGGTLRTGRYEHHIQTTLAASTGWYGYRYNATNATKWVPYYETGYWDGASLNTGFRGWADVVEYDQEVTSITVRQIRNTAETTVHIVYLEIVGAYAANAQLIKEIVLPADTSGTNREMQEFSVTPFTMLKNGLVTAFFFNNNLSDAIGHFCIYVNYKEKI